jgi:hypothetical protein
MDSQTRKALVRKRAAVKARMTNIKKYVDSLPETVDRHGVNVRLQLLEKVWEEYNAVQDQLEDDDDETQQHELDREAVTETYCELRARIDRIISEDRRAKDVSLAELQKSRAMHENGNTLTLKIKLPTIKIPKFRGQITEFRHFYDTFSSLIINNQALDDVKKFHYLLSSVTNEAHQLIQNLPVTQQNLSATDLRALINQFQSNLNAIKAIDLSIPLHEELLSQILIDHVDEATRKQWEMKAVSQGITELESIIKFLEGKCQALAYMICGLSN